MTKYFEVKNHDTGETIRVEAADAAAAEAKALQQWTSGEARSGWGAFARGLRSGAAMGFDDEALAAIPGEAGSTYDQRRKEYEATKAAYASEHPIASGAGNVVGALAGALIPGGIAAKGVGAGVKAAGYALPELGFAGKTLLASGSGATGAAVTKMGDSDGSAQDRWKDVTNRDMIMGAALGAGGATASMAFGKILGGLTDMIGARSTQKVENEVRRIADEAGLTPEAVANGVRNGQVFAEMTDSTRMALRVLADRGGPTLTQIRDTVTRRAGSAVNSLRDTMNRTLAGIGPDENLAAKIKLDDAGAREAEGRAFEDVFLSAPSVGDAITAQIVEIARRDPSVAASLAKTIAVRTGEKPFFTLAADGTMDVIRSPSLQEAELMRRMVGESASSAYKGGAGALGEGWRALEGKLRTAIDDFSPSLKAVRTDAAAIRSARDAGKSGTTALSRGVDEVGVDLDAINALPPEAREGALKAYRAGIMVTLRKRMENSAGRTSTAKRMADLDARERQIVEMVLPPEHLAAVSRSSALADSATRLRDEIVGGSQTSQRMAGAQRVGQGGGITGAVIEGAANLGTAGVSGFTAGLTRSAVTAMRAMGGDLSDREVQRVVDFMLSTDPRATAELFKKGDMRQIAATVAQNNVIMRSSAAAGAGAQAPGLLDMLGLEEGR